MPVIADFEGQPDFVLSLARGLEVIEAFEDRPGGVTVSEIAASTGLSRAAVRRVLITLEGLGYATHSGPTYRLGSRVLRLGFAFLSSHSLPALATPILERVSASIRESSSLAVLEGDEIVYFARSATRRVMSVGLAVGSRLPAYCTSMGRVLLAALPDDDLKERLGRMMIEPRTPKTITTRRALAAAIRRARREGYALVDEELELGLRSIAVPVVTRSGCAVAAINSGVNVSRVSATEIVRRVLPVLRDAAATLGRALP